MQCSTKSLLRPLFFVFLMSLALTVAATPLDDYVKAPDASFKYGPDPVKTIAKDTFTTKIWKMTSQSWRSPSEIDRTQWEHWVTVNEPKEVTFETAMMFIGGGSNGKDEPSEGGEILGTIATMTNTIVAEVAMIPNQPLKVADEKDAHYKERGRSEDAFIAYTWDKCMVTGDTNWPARLPMTKAVVRAMDLVQAQYPKVKSFFVVGGSKRGWTTWTTAAVDPRVIGMAPAIIDVLNVENSMQHHHDVYGYWADAIGDYTDLKIMDRIHTPEFRKLMKVVDPYFYIDRYTMPKFIMASCGDQFFLPDSSQFYFDALKGPKYLRYCPNTDHGLSQSAYFDLLAYYAALLNKSELPKFTWTKQADGSLVVKPETQPTSVKLWQASNPNARNFRLDTIGKAWTSSDLSPENGVYTGKVKMPEKGWTAFMVELEYPGIGFPLKFTTEVSVVPQTIPFRNVGGWGKISTAGKDADIVTVVEVGGDRYQMGYWYARLVADQMARAWNGLLADVKAPEEIFTNAINSLWNGAYFDTVLWEQELRGMADGCQDAGHPELTFRTMQKMLSVADISENGCSLFAAWGKATVNGDLYQERNLDWSMTTGLQNYPVVVIYNPTDGGRRHALVGFAGLIGAGVGGMNDAGLAVSEIMGHFGDKETLEGTPFPVLLRDVLYYDTTLDQGLTRMKNAVRTNQYHYALADPGAPDPKGRLLFTSHSRFDAFTDDQVCTKHPVVDPTPFYEKLDDVVYWKNHNGSGNKIIFDAIKERYGKIDADKAIEIARAAGVDGTLVSIIYHNTGRDVYVAYAEGPTPAHKQNYIHIELNQK